MRLTTLLYFSASSLILSLPFVSSVQADSMQNLGDLSGGGTYGLAWAISANGNVIVGRSDSANGGEAFIWTQGTGLTGLGDLAGGTFDSISKAVSADGRVIVGTGRVTNDYQAFIWTQATGLIALGTLDVNSDYSEATGVSADGTIAVGVTVGANGYEAFRWTQATGMVGLGDIAGGANFSYANGISADGNVIVGTGNSVNGYEAMRWTQATGMVGLGDLAGGIFDSTAYAVNKDGSVIVGFGESASGKEAFRWTAATGMVGLGDLAGGSFDSTAYAVSANGDVIVGKGTTASGDRAFRWIAATGMQSLESLLTAEGVDLTGYALTNAYGVNATGNLIVGEATYGGNSIAYLANITSGGITTPEDLAAGLSSAIVPTQQLQSAANNYLGQSLFAATQSASLFARNPRNIFATNISPASIAPAAGDDQDRSFWEQDLERRWAAYAVGSFGIGQNNDTDNTSLNGTTGLMVQINKELIVGAGVIGSHNKSDMAFGGESKLNAMGGSLVTSYEDEIGLRLYGSAFAANLNIDTNRRYANGAGTTSSQGSTSGIGYGAAARAGWEFDALSDTRVMPYAEVQASKTKLDAYEETGGPFPASFSKSNGHQITTKLGTQVSYDVTPHFTVSTRLAWAHKLHEENDTISASTSGFTGTLGSPSGDRNWGELSMEAGWQVTPDTYLSAELSGRSGRTEDPAGYHPSVLASASRDLFHP